MTIENWAGPTVEDQRLFEAQRFDDLDKYMQVLARIDVFVPKRDDKGSKKKAELLDKFNAMGKAGAFNKKIRGTSASPLAVGMHYATTKKGLRLLLPVYTRAMLPVERPEDVYYEQNMFPGWVAEMARVRQTMQIVVNPGTPLERELNVGKAATWLKHNPQAVGRWSDLRGTVRTMWNEPVSGELAVALACGAHLAVQNAVPWNTLGREMLDYVQERETLSEWWGVTSAEEWRQQADALLDTQRTGPIDVVLGLRAQRGAGVEPTGDLNADTAALSQAVTDWCREQGAPEDSWRDLMDIAQWVTRCESWMRMDGVLPPGGIVATQAAWDLGRAVNMARWGLASGYCDRVFAEQVVLHAGALCRQAYETWDQLSAAYILGRVVKMGRQGDPERTYRESLALHQALTRDQTSPWRNFPLR